MRGERSFRIAMPDYSAWLVLVPLLKRLWAEAPHVRVQVRPREALFAVPDADLRSGALEAAVGRFPDVRGLPVDTPSEDTAPETVFVNMDDQGISITLKQHLAAICRSWLGML